MSSLKPKVLIVSLETWEIIARLPKALQKSGFEVAALCHRDSFLATTRYVDQLFFLNSRRWGSRILRQLMQIIKNWNPILIVSGDDRTVLFLLRMIQLHLEGKQPLPPNMLETLRLSFGNFDWMAEATSKRLTLQRAQELGLKTPRFACVNSVVEAVSRAKEFGWPVVVKKSTGWGGNGVTFCDSEDQVAAIYAKYREASGWKGMLKSRLMQFRGWTLGPDWFPADHSVTVNEFIRGKPTTISVAAAAGKILAHVTAIREQCYPDARGPSSVVRFINHPDMMRTAEKMIGHWGASGLLGFDFMLTDDGEATLIECHSRPIVGSYMGRLSGRDLCLALHHHLAGLEIPAPSAPSHEIVARFPQEWRRDPQSPYLLNAYHDVPWDDPGLFEKLLRDCR